MFLEVVCQSSADVKIATENGADRIELCSALELGGLSPIIYPHISKVPINALIRPRPGGFIYSADDMLDVQSNIMAACEHNYGIVFGALTNDNQLDIKLLSQITNVKSWTFHRAFDIVKNPADAIKQLIDLGVDTILTSGGAPTVKQGLKNLEHYVKVSKGQIEIMAGGGLAPSDIPQLHNIGINWAHTSASELNDNGGAVGPGGGSNPKYMRVGSDKLKKFRTAINSL